MSTSRSPANDNNGYQNQLDRQILKAQGFFAAADNKVDMFLDRRPNYAHK